MKEIDKSTVKAPEYVEIFKKEPHHGHPVIEDANQILRWKKNPDVCRCILKLDLNYLIMLLELLGHNKNSEIYRKLYRDIGYSLSGYYEIFYWDINNPLEDEYVAPKTEHNGK